MTRDQHLPMERFGDNARDALADATLRDAVHRGTHLLSSRRRTAIAEFAAGDVSWQDLRDRGRALKDATLARLDHHLEEFERNATARGITVHWARDAREANRVITEIATAAGATTAVKSKSMTSEETRLGAALEAHGVESIETDLGEWIIQLAGEVPSHIIVPAIHKTQRQVGELFASHLGTDPAAHERELTAIAREALRERFTAAGIGITGANFAIAETGCIVIVENEGNARLTTTLPRVHIALMGIEKVIAAHRDLEVFLQLLPRAGTGQPMTSYVSVLGGPASTPDATGPEAMHVVILDNGRSAMLARDVTRQSLACIRCGACLNVCPVYRNVGGHAYGSVYPGPIGAVITPQLSGLGKAAELPFASSLCGACEDACPVKIDIPALLLHLRAEVVAGRARGRSGDPGPPRRRLERFAFGVWRRVVAGRRRYEFATGLARRTQWILVRGGRIGPVGRLLRRLAPALAAWTAQRDLRPLAPRSFRSIWDRELQRGRPRD